MDTVRHGQYTEIWLSSCVRIELTGIRIDDLAWKNFFGFVPTAGVRVQQDSRCSVSQCSPHQVRTELIRIIFQVVFLSFFKAQTSPKCSCVFQKSDKRKWSWCFCGIGRGYQLWQWRTDPTCALQCGRGWLHCILRHLSQGLSIQASWKRWEPQTAGNLTLCAYSKWKSFRNLRIFLNIIFGFSFKPCPQRNP